MTLGFCPFKRGCPLFKVAGEHCVLYSECLLSRFHCTGEVIMYSAQTTRNINIGRYLNLAF